MLNLRLESYFEKRPLCMLAYRNCYNSVRKCQQIDPVIKSSLQWRCISPASGDPVLTDSRDRPPARSRRSSRLSAGTEHVLWAVIQSSWGRLPHCPCSYLPEGSTCRFRTCSQWGNGQVRDRLRIKMDLGTMSGLCEKYNMTCPDIPHFLGWKSKF